MIFCSSCYQEYEEHTMTFIDEELIYCDNCIRSIENQHIMRNMGRYDDDYDQDIIY